MHTNIKKNVYSYFSFLLGYIKSVILHLPLLKELIEGEQ